MKGHDKVIFSVVLVLLLAILGLNFYAQSSTTSSQLVGASASSNLLTGAVIGEASLSGDVKISAGTSCWNYTTNATCSAVSGCSWKSDHWGSWCQELNCWSLSTQGDCLTTNISGKSCNWQVGSTWSNCEKKTCWGFAGTNQTACESNSAGLSCRWDNSCYFVGGAASGVSCWGLSQSVCINTTGCSWGQCWEKSCNSYTTNSTCITSKDPWSGKNCTWQASSSTCTENRCWNTQLYPNKTACNAATGCEWKWDSCQEKTCSSFDFTNASTCENNSVSLGCKWSSPNYCQTKDCWNINSQSACAANTQCTWRTWTSTGWCEERNCWNFDSFKGGNQSSCVNNSYGLDCVWSGNPSGNATNGWCYKDTSKVSCGNYTTERECVDTFYCWWRPSDLTGSTGGGTCATPDWSTISGVNGSILNNWNPGCYIFDLNQTNCEYVLGCNYANAACDEATAGGEATRGANISTSGISCAYINDSTLCNNLAILSSCCSWQNGTCAESRSTNSCYSNLKATPNGEDSCDDAKTKSACDTIATDPWYMPCTWENSTTECKVKTGDLFGNRTQSLIRIENQKVCEAAGGRWVTENYCEGNISVPSGRCEYKFDEERNCDKACFACENYDSDGNTVNASNAEDACEESKLGFCEFESNSAAPNGIGFCKAKEAWKKGVAGDCDSNCGDCTFSGNSNSTDATKRPSYFCTSSKANSGGGGCKWVSDNTTTTGGYCLNKGEKTCEDACDRCDSQTECTNTGRTGVANTTGSCKWQGDENDGTCVANVGEDVEVCWDGTDNDNDGFVDCADPACYSDSFCGFVSGDCFGWTTNDTCIANSCEWVTDKWGSWCDFKGSQCWKYDQNSTTCNVQSNCQWNNGSNPGSGFCERDWTVGEACFSALNESHCTSISAGGKSCVWTNDTWCSGTGANSEWCTSGKGGWCDHPDFKPKDCWQNQESSSQCNQVSGCTWKADTFSTARCEVNWSVNCWDYVNQSSCQAASCTWRNDSWGSWCDNSFGLCWSKNTESTCNAVTGVSCTWRNYSGGGGSCEPSCFTTTTQAGCSAISGCFWKAESGWCEEAAAAGCYASNVSNIKANCSVSAGCRWKDSGWCEPKDGFSAGSFNSAGGVGGSSGAECYKYDGNQSLCTNKTAINISCGWFADDNPHCEPNWGKDCWQYPSAEGGCNATNGCWWNPDGNWCGNLADQCWNNATLKANATACDANPYCNSTSYGCEPTCFSQTASATCGGIQSNACKWITGWCNPAGVNQLFDGIQGGAPVPLGLDTCPDSGVAKSVDFCGFGLKDMGDAYGFGANVVSFVNSTVCNKEKVKVGASEVTGSGNESVNFIVYLDSDGLTTGGCALENNASALGYEFKLRYASIWNSTLSKGVETFTAYKCDNSKWVQSDLKMNAWAKIMCSEIGGPMIAVEKGELSRFPTLYDSSSDLRVYVASFGATGNTSSPQDTSGPGWSTPGSVDFEIADAFSYNADKAKFEDILKKGFVQYEDCFNTIDDDDDGNSDCSDWDCQFSPVCTSKGVNSLTYVDTTTPQVVGVKIEEYPDAALVMYDTNKPANGTLEFYGTDSTCLTVNATVNDVGITRSNIMRAYKLWHKADVYSATVGYALQANTTYYYKLKACDNAGKCAISRCTSFRTEISQTNCPFCNFVTRLKVPDGWSVAYDVNRDGTYEHGQGLVCGANAGMKINYTQARAVNILLNRTDGSTYFVFVNVSLSKTALNDKVRSLSSTGQFINGSTLVGLSSDARDKIINNLHPEICRVKIPNSGSCTTLYHCDDNGANCQDRTAEATLIDATNCVWQVPYCEFSTYRTTTGSSSSSSSSSSGSSGGGGGGGGTGGGGSVPVKKAVDAAVVEEEPAVVAETPGEGASAPAGEATAEAATGTVEESSPLVWVVGAIAVLAVAVLVGVVLYLRREE